MDEITVWQDAKLPEAIARDAGPVDDAGKAYAELIAHFTPEGAIGTTLTDTFQPGPPPEPGHQPRLAQRQMPGRLP
ncbi:hypothetical protein ACH4KT_10820 [Streptomyces anulatus]